MRSYRPTITRRLLCASQSSFIIMPIKVEACTVMTFDKTFIAHARDRGRLDNLIGSIEDELSLEATILRERAQELRKESVKLARQRAFLREERRKVREEAEMIEYEMMQIKAMKAKTWFPTDSLPDIAKNPEHPLKTVKLNIGGQIFEASEKVLRRDEGSLLASLCDEKSPLELREEGVVYFDRDWWLFRYILMFLRDGMLPEDKRLLAQLYREADFWRLTSMRRAIEETQFNLTRTRISVDAGGKIVEEELKQSWWKALPSWLEAERAEASKPADGEKQKDGGDKGKEGAAEAKGGGGGETKGKLSLAARLLRGAKEKEKEPKKEPDWWLSSEYKGRKFGALSSAPDKVVTDEDKEDAIPMLRSTWHVPPESKAVAKTTGGPPKAPV